MQTRQSGATPEQEESVAIGRWWRTTVRVVVALAVLAVAIGIHKRHEVLMYLFGPPMVTLREAYQRRPDGPTFDHSVFDALLRRHVDSDGWVDYEGVRRDVASLDSYIATLRDAPFADLGRDEKLALLINAYNAFTLRLILDHYPVNSIRDIPSAERWDAKRWRVGALTLSLNEIEHEQIRPKFKEPRIHFALVCAAISCPKLRNEAYEAGRIEEQLDDQTHYVHSHDRWFQFEPGGDGIRLTELYDWYGADFEQTAGSVLKFAARYSPPLHAALEKNKARRIAWIMYNWTLNDTKNDK